MPVGIADYTTVPHIVAYSWEEYGVRNFHPPQRMFENHKFKRVNNIIVSGWFTLYNEKSETFLHLPEVRVR